MRWRSASPAASTRRASPGGSTARATQAERRAVGRRTRPRAAWSPWLRGSSGRRIGHTDRWADRGVPARRLGQERLDCAHAGALRLNRPRPGCVCRRRDHTPEGWDWSSGSSHQTRVEPRSCQAPHVSQSSSTSNSPRPPGVSGSGGSMQGLRREPGSVTAIRTRSSNVVTSTLSARPAPTLAWSTLLVTSSLTSSAASNTVVAGISPSSCERTHRRAREGAP
jgi:hypothetical protein